VNPRDKYRRLRPRTELPPYRNRPSSFRPDNRAPSRIWIVANSALFLWILTTVIVGSVSAVWTKRLECRATYAEAEQKFVRSLAEYQYRQNGYYAARRKARTPEERQAAEKWKSSTVSSQFAFQSKTMADVALDMLRSFGDLALVSDIKSFDISQDGLSISRRDGTGSVLVTPSIDVLESLKLGGQMPNLPSKDVAAPQVRPGISAEFERLRENLFGADSTLNAVRTAAMLKPRSKCGPVDVISRLFVDTNPVYERQVDRLFSAMMKEYQHQMVMLLAIEQLSSQPTSQSSPMAK